MNKNWTSLGLMSGTSGDGVDASLIKTNGIDEYEVLANKYFEYDYNIYKDIHTLKEKIHKISHLEEFDSELNDLERKITIFHAEIIKELKIDEETIVGFHGQTIYHNFKEKISRLDFKIDEVKGLEFNPITQKWKKSENLSVNYIVTSIKN